MTASGSGEALHIRSARDSDRAAIRDLTLAAYEEYAAVLPEALWTGYRRNILATLDGDEPADRIVAEHEGAIAGSVLLFPPSRGAYGDLAAGGDSPEVRLLAVSPAVRGQGVGAALMRECIRRARASGAAALGLHTTDMMRTAMRMYERMGFVRAPALDFNPAPGMLIKGYRLDLRGPG
ncbi:MAG TPA: GNAT family N-acetyltransferase [bacterium]|nr:GNAT family N-acetyltransferase [bacterium]